MSQWNDPELKKLFLNSTPLIDVRSEIEFTEGSLPHSVNLPIMNTEERILVGTCYKEQGQAAAIELGHKLVSGSVKEERIQKWKNFIQDNPEAQVFCFRGGLRSQISCEWIRSAGIERYPIKGGYKRMRRFFLSQLDEAPIPELFRIGGLTGSGKTQFLQKIHHSIDLEKLANHRGSAFGGNGPQPSQVSFENELSLELMKNERRVIVEDESPMIGRVTIPRRFYQSMKEAPLIVLRTTMEDRVQNIFREYVLNSGFAELHGPLLRISKRLGGLRFQELENQLKDAFEKEKTAESHRPWIEGLLKYYYDPVYEEGLRRQPGKILFEGKAEDILQFLASMSKT